MSKPVRMTVVLECDTVDMAVEALADINKATLQVSGVHMELGKFSIELIDEEEKDDA